VLIAPVANATTGDVTVLIHPVEPPVASVVRVEEDDLRNDPQGIQLRDPLLKVLPEGRMKLTVVPGAVLSTKGTLKWVEARLVVGVRVPFREDGHPDLVERGTLQRSERLLLEDVALGLVDPGV